MYDVAVHARAGRAVGLSLDEIDLARRFTSRDEDQAPLLRYIEIMLDNRGEVPVHLHEERASTDGPTSKSSRRSHMWHLPTLISCNACR